MNLYVPNAQLDAPFGYGDLEWLYRQQDVDGGSLVSRLAQLAPVSFTNTIDGQRRRRLFSLDSWEMNNFVWTNDNPGIVYPNAPRATITPFATQSRASPQPNAGFPYLGTPPGLVHPAARPSRQEDQPQLPPAGLERPRRADPAEVDLRHVPAPQVRPAPPGRRYSGRAGPAQPVRDQHHRFPRPGLHDDPLAEPGRPARAGTARESLGKRADARDGPHAGPGLLQPGQRHPPGPVRHGVQPGRAQRGTRVLLCVHQGGGRRPTGSSSSWSTR